MKNTSKVYLRFHFLLRLTLFQSTETKEVLMNYFLSNEVECEKLILKHISNNLIVEKEILSQSHGININSNLKSISYLKK